MKATCTRVAVASAVCCLAWMAAGQTASAAPSQLAPSTSASIPHMPEASQAAVSGSLPTVTVARGAADISLVMRPDKCIVL